MIFCHYVRKVVMDIITFPVNLLTTSGLLILIHGQCSDSMVHDVYREEVIPLHLFAYHRPYKRPYSVISEQVKLINYRTSEDDSP